MNARIFMNASILRVRFQYANYRFFLLLNEYVRASATGLGHMGWLLCSASVLRIRVVLCRL